jgi:glutamine synthetase
VEGLDLAIHARDKQLAGMAAVREVADRLEKLVADDLWPLPKYSEILFVR